MIRGYLQALPLINVMSYDTSVFNRKNMPHVSFLDKSCMDELIHNEMINFLNVMRFSRSVNDVSHLPGNYVINEVMEIKLRNNADFVVMYLDIDKFKAFDDYYGIYKSGQVIQYLSTVVIDLFEKYGTPEDFVGHVGGMTS